MIQVNNLNKSFEDFVAVNNISFSIKKGEVFGFLGPNGAGKSTTINMLSSIIKSDSGTIEIDERNILAETNKCKKLIGVVPQEVSLYDEFSAYENLLFWGKLYQVPINELKDKVLSILDLIGLKDRKDELIKNYSGGMKRRINIASALLHNPKVLFMDEPTVGVDPQSRNRIFEIVETLNKQGMTIIYTTHYMEEVERLCNRIAIMDEGEIIAQGTLSELQKQSDVKEEIHIKLNSIDTDSVEKLQKVTGLEITNDDNSITIYGDVNKELSKVIEASNNLNLTIEDIELKKVNLESIFLSLTGKKLRD